MWLEVVHTIKLINICTNAFRPIYRTHVFLFQDLGDLVLLFYDLKILNPNH
jgi:hypothetical protein